jgi:hypothetical protein
MKKPARVKVEQARASLKFYIFQASRTRASERKKGAAAKTTIALTRHPTHYTRLFFTKKNIPCMYATLCEVPQFLNLLAFFFFHIHIRAHIHTHIYSLTSSSLRPHTRFLYFILLFLQPTPPADNKFSNIHHLGNKNFNGMSRLWWSIYGIFCGCYVCVRKVKLWGGLRCGGHIQWREDGWWKHEGGFLSVSE